MKSLVPLKLLVIIILLGLVWAIQNTGANAANKLRIVTTTPDLAEIAQAVGGEHVEVFSIARGTQNIHFIPGKPSFILKLKDADMLVQVGMGLEIWLQPLVDGARNPRVFTGGKGFVNASEGIKPLRLPVGQPDRLMGDIHGAGNPHYWLDPVNAKIVAYNILKGLERVDPSHQAEYEANYKAFLKELAAHLTTWLQRTKPLKGVRVISYHDTWPYFTQRFGLNVVGFVEPKPGIPPSPQHIRKTIEQIKAERIPFIIMEPYFSRTVPDMIARETGARVIVLPSSVGGVPGATDYFKLFDEILNRLLSKQ